LAEKESNSVTLSKDLFYGILIMGMAVLLVISVMTQGFGLVKGQAPACPVCGNNTGTTGGNTGGNQSGSTNGTATIKTMQVPAMLSQSPLQGSSSSTVTVLEFSDFQCPFCGMTYGSPWSSDYASQYGAIIGTVKKVETDYVQTSKIAFRHYPVAFLGQESADASNAAMCANAQGKYWEMHNAIFENQTPEENDGKYSKANLKAIASAISGLDTTAFASCVDADTYKDTVTGFTSDWQTVSAANVGRAGTPTFYILVDATKLGKDKVSSAATGAGYDWGLSSDSKTYVIVASPEYAKLKQVIDALLA
jgi:protein-disulfide isomerase